jgi:hypothetical protein
MHAAPQVVARPPPAIPVTRRAVVRRDSRAEGIVPPDERKDARSPPSAPHCRRHREKGPAREACPRGNGARAPLLAQHRLRHRFSLGCPAYASRFLLITSLSSFAPACQGGVAPIVGRHMSPCTEHVYEGPAEALPHSTLVASPGPVLVSASRRSICWVSVRRRSIRGGRWSADVGQGSAKHTQRGRAADEDHQDRDHSP